MEAAMLDFKACLNLDHRGNEAALHSYSCYANVY